MVEHPGQLLRLVHEHQMPRCLRPVERRLEKEPQSRHRGVHGWRLGAGLAQMQLEGAQLFRTRGAGRAPAEKTGELLDGADILTLRIGGEIAHRHVFDHAGAQGADRLGIRWRHAHLKAPVLRWKCLDQTPRSSRQGARPVSSNLSDGYRVDIGHCYGSSDLARSVFVHRPVAEIQHSTKQCGASVRGLWSTSAKSNPAAVAKIVDLTRRRDRLIPLGGR